MNLLDRVHRTPVPAPWAEGEKIPWDDPAFSARMLVEHLSQAHAALDERGLLLLEPAYYEAVRQRGQAGSTWYGAGSGLFSDRPHLALEESFWDEESRTTTTRYYVVDAASGEVTAHASTEQAYTDEELRDLLAECDFGEVRFYPSLAGIEDQTQEGFFALVARKQ